MIIISVPRIFLGPLPFVIFTANFLPDCWIGHIKDAKDKTTQMSQVGDAPSSSSHRRKEFNQTKNDDKVFSRDRKEKVD